MTKLVNRIPVVETVSGEEYIYGADVNGTPKYFPLKLLGDTAINSGIASGENANRAEVAKTQTDLAVVKVQNVLNDISKLTEDSRAAFTKADQARLRTSNLEASVNSKLQTIQSIETKVKKDSLDAQLACEYAKQAAASANSKYPYESKVFDTDSSEGQVDFAVPMGWYPIAVYVEGRIRRNGKNKDWLLQTYGNQDHVIFAVSPGKDAWVSILAGRKE